MPSSQSVDQQEWKKKMPPEWANTVAEEEYKLAHQRFKSELEQMLKDHGMSNSSYRRPPRYLEWNPGFEVNHRWWCDLRERLWRDSCERAAAYFEMGDFPRAYALDRIAHWDKEMYDTASFNKWNYEQSLWGQVGNH